VAQAQHLEYGSSDVRAFLDGTAERHTADGVPLPELRRAARAISDWDGWVPHWLDRAAALEAAATGAGTDASRRQLLVTAMLAAHLAQYLHFAEPDVRRTALERKIALYRAAAPLLSPPARPVTIPFGAATLRGYLRVPPGLLAAPACVIYVGGLDAHKEDGHGLAELCVERGLAVLTFDGPGQGEALLDGAVLDGAAHGAVSAAIDVLEGDADVDAGRIGVIGRSLGGYLAPRAAADDSRIGALAVWGAMYDLSNFRELPGHTRAGFTTVTGAIDEDDAARRVGFIDLTGHAERISCPTLVVHGAADTVTPPWNAERMAAEISGPVELELVPDSPHCNHDVAHLVRPRMVDWLAGALA
jgi:2,6-dihydroxypseudooxynicotine hydrolase